MIARFAQSSVATPLGPMRLVASDEGLAFAGTSGERSERFERWAAARLASARRVESLPALDAATAQLGEYFAGTRKVFDVPLDVVGTPFQRRMWARLVAIPFGKTTTYGDLARELGSSGGERAVGAANGANVVAIVVPCHRVVGADGALTGYAGGVRAKAKLIAHERHFALQARLLVES